MKKNKMNSMLFFSMTLQYLEVYLPKQMGRSPETIRSYRDSLSSFRQFLYLVKNISIARFRFHACDRKLLLEYMAYLKGNNSSPATCNLRLAAIKNYVQYAADNDVSLQSISLLVSKVPGQKIPKREKLLLSKEALAVLLAQPRGTKIGVRDRTIMILLYDSAIRVSELTGLHINDVNLDTLSIHVHGKGNKDRSVAITAKTAGHLKAYRKIYHQGISDPEHFLFFTVIKGVTGRISTGTVERLIQKYADEARIACPEMPARVYPHLFRAERATHLYRDGVDSIMVSKILGHSSVETTMMYAIPSVDQMREAMKKTEIPTETIEQPIWVNNEDELVRLCGLK